MRLRGSQLRLGDRLISDDGTPGPLVTRLSTRNGETTVSHPSGHTRLIGDPPLRVLRPKSHTDAGRDTGRDVSHPSDNDADRIAHAGGKRLPEQGLKRRTSSVNSRPQRLERPAPTPVFLAAEHTPHQ